MRISACDTFTFFWESKFWIREMNCKIDQTKNFPSFKNVFVWIILNNVSKIFSLRDTIKTLCYRKVRTKRDWPVAFWNFYQVFSVSYSLLSSCLTTISKEFFGQSYFSFHKMIIFLPMSRQNHYCWCQSNNVKWARICMELR